MSHGLVPYEEVQAREEAGTIGITAVTKLKHADLWAAAQKFQRRGKNRKTRIYGGQSAMARFLKVPAMLVSKWINLQECPPAEPRGKFWTARRLMRLETKLFKLTGKSLEELFPAELRANIQFLSAPKTFERTVHLEQTALTHYAVATRDRLLLEQQVVPPSAIKEELQEKVAKLLETLKPREREILEHRFGLNGREPHTLEETGRIFGIRRERVRQIEAKAIRNLYRPADQEELIDFMQ